MLRIFVAFVAGAVPIVAAPFARAHAFLDHAIPAVGSSVPASPAVVTLWFTQDLEPAFSDVTVKPLPPGTYTVSWHVVSVDTHPTEGTFTFEVGTG